MSFHDNPFIRGYWNLDVQRLLEIVQDQKSLPLYRPLHPSQALLSDHEIVLKSCILHDGDAVITEGQRVPRALRAPDDARGFVLAVRYAIQADDDGQTVHLGDARSLEQANAVIRRLKFETEFYSRCWEISRWHLDRAAFRYLEGVALATPPFGPLFSAFRLRSDVFGVKLIGTPWNDAHLRDADGTTVAALRQAFLKHGIPHRWPRCCFWREKPMSAS